MAKIKFLFALWLARLIRWAINIIAPGRGTNLPGQIALKIDRGFPTAGIVVQDQGYVDTSTPLKAGLYQPVSPDVDSINLECYIHSEDDIPKEEDEEDSEEGDASQDDGNGFGWSDILAQFTP